MTTIAAITAKVGPSEVKDLSDVERSRNDGRLQTVGRTYRRPVGVSIPDSVRDGVTSWWEGDLPTRRTPRAELCDAPDRRDWKKSRLCLDPLEIPSLRI